MNLSLDIVFVAIMDPGPQAEAFAGWLAWHQESSAKRQLLHNAVQSLQQGAVGRAFRSWATRSRENARLRAMAVTCLARMQLAVQHRAFASWRRGAHGALEARCDIEIYQSHDGFKAWIGREQPKLLQGVTHRLLACPGLCWPAAVRTGEGRRWRAAWEDGRCIALLGPVVS